MCNVAISNFLYFILQSPFVSFNKAVLSHIQSCIAHCVVTYTIMHRSLCCHSCIIQILVHNIIIHHIIIVTFWMKTPLCPPCPSSPLPPSLLGWTSPPAPWPAPVRPASAAVLPPSLKAVPESSPALSLLPLLSAVPAGSAPPAPWSGERERERRKLKVEDTMSRNSHGSYFMLTAQQVVSINVEVSKPVSSVCE